GLATPSMVALATRRRAAELLAGIGSSSEGLEALAQLWLVSPDTVDVGLDQVDLLAAMGLLDSAIALCERTETRLAPEQHERFVATYFSLVAARLAQGPDADLEERAEERARALLRGSRSVGIAVHYL